MMTCQTDRTPSREAPPSDLAVRIVICDGEGQPKSEYTLSAATLLDRPELERAAR